MPSHLHLVASVETGLLNTVLRDFKSFTAKELLRLIQDNPQESRKEWMLYLLRYFGRQNRLKEGIQFWQETNHPVDLVTPQMTRQRVNYIHQNPVEAGLVHEPQNYAYSSANQDSLLKVLPL
jgi:putative transposase